MVSLFKKAFWLLGAGVIFLILFLPGFVKLLELKEKNRQLEDKIRQVNIENALLTEELARIESDPIYQEKLAREKMGVVRKGEIPVKIIPARKR